MRRTSARELYRNCVEAGADLKGEYRAACAETHWMVGVMRRSMWKTGRIKGLRRACWNAKIMAMLMDVFTLGNETGVQFWVEKYDELH